jgi:hypothetical protein
MEKSAFKFVTNPIKSLREISITFPKFHNNNEDSSEYRKRDPLFRSCGLRIHLHFMEPDSSLPCSKWPAICPFPEKEQSNSYPKRIYFS